MQFAQMKVLWNDENAYEYEIAVNLLWKIWKLNDEKNI